MAKHTDEHGKSTPAKSRAAKASFSYPYRRDPQTRLTTAVVESKPSRRSAKAKIISRGRKNAARRADTKAVSGKGYNARMLRTE